MKRGLKKSLGIGLIFIYVLSITPFPVLAQEEAYPIRLASGETITLTASQLEDILQCSGIRFSETEPVLRPDEMALSIPEELGGGYIVGAAKSIANAFGSVGIAVGVGALTGVTVVVPLATIAGLGGAIGFLAYLLAPPSEEEVHPPAAHHHP